MSSVEKMQTSTAVMRTATTLAIIVFTIWTKADIEEVGPCCVSVTRSRVVEPIKDFKFQKRNLPCVKAVIFETETGRFCIDPRQPWVRKKAEELMTQRKNQSSTEKDQVEKKNLTYIKKDQVEEKNLTYIKKDEDEEKKFTFVMFETEFCIDIEDN